MTKGFTLIELMIVIAIIAIIAAIAIPNLLESRITANESAAATSLRSGLLPAQAQFKSTGLVDDTSATANGVGSYAGDFPSLSGSSGAGTTTALGPAKACNFMSAQWNNRSALAAAGTVATITHTAGSPAGGLAVGTLTNVGAYNYALVRSLVNAESENYWGAYAIPVNAEAALYTGEQGRKSFCISTGGDLLQTAGTVLNVNLDFPMVSGQIAGGGAFSAGTNTMFGTDPRIGSPTRGTAAVPYVK